MKLNSLPFLDELSTKSNIDGTTNYLETDLEKYKARRIKDRFHRELIARVYDLIEEHMSPHQKTVIAFHLKGLSYLTIATLMGISYTAIAHAIKGIKGPTGVTHGGIEKKLTKICNKDLTCIRLIAELRRLR